MAYQPLHWNHPRVHRLLLKTPWKATSKANLLSMALNSLCMDPHFQWRLENWGKTEIHFWALCKVSVHTDYINTQHHSKGLQNRTGFVGVHLYFAMGLCPCLSLVLRCSLSRSEFWRCKLQISRSLAALYYLVDVSLGVKCFEQCDFKFL